MDNVQASITCPITNEIMTDPVSGSDGHTYERSAIVTALQYRQESPMTREYMSATSLKLNVAIKFLCDKYHNGELCILDNDISNNKETNNNTKYNANIETTITTNSRKNLMISFTSDIDIKDNEQLPQDIVICIDRSGSMNSAVTAKDEHNNNIENGMSIQDIVNHAAKTVAKTLDKDSRLSIIIFDNLVEVLFTLVNMTDINKSMAINKITQIKPCGQTNIWGAIDKAIEILNERNDKSRNPAILLLTDGSPNIRPARGEIETLKRMKLKTEFSIPIYTFGFGYSLEKSLLYDIAKYGNGANGHISDGGMIATVFCNFTGVVMTTVAVNLTLYIKSTINTKTINLQECVMGDFATTLDTESGYTKFELGTIQYQQSRNIIIDIENILEKTKSTNFEYYYTYRIGNIQYKSTVIRIDDNNIVMFKNNQLVDANICRFKMVEYIRRMINLYNVNDVDSVKIEYQTLYKLIEENLENNPNNYLLNGMLENLCGNTKNRGQIELAIESNYFNKWGEFYLDQLSRALNQEIKPNFKDEGCRFGGEMFNDIVDKASDIFDNLEPPNPSLIRQNSYTSSNNYQPLRSLAVYNNLSGGCFSTDCYITLANGNEIRVNQLKPNMLIQSLDNNHKKVTARVLCIFETCVNRVIDMVKFDNGLVITPWHPIYYNDAWVFPTLINPCEPVYCARYLTLVLDNHHIAIVNKTPVITLASQFKTSMLNHPYYSTNNVIDSLKKHDNYNKQHIQVDIDSVKFIRDNNNIVCDMIFT